MPGPGDRQIADELAKHVPNFDIAAARAAGVSDSLIVNELAPKVPQFDVASARAHFAGVPRAAGTDQTARISPADPLGIPQPHMGTPGIAFADQAINALSLGQGPRIAAAVQAALGHGTYAGNKARFDASLTEDRRDHGVAASIGSLYGLLGNPLNEAAAVKPWLGGAALGAVQGSGAAGDDAKSQVVGTLLGAASGAAGGGVVRGAQILGGPSAGQRVVTAALEKSPEVEANLARMVATGRGDHAVLADLAPRLNGILDRAANRNPDVMDKVQGIVTARQPDAAGRVMNDMTDAVGNPHLAQLAEQLKQQRLAFAGGPSGFQGLRDANPSLPVNADLADVLKRPGMKDALELAQKADKLDGTNSGQAISRMFGQKGLGMTSMSPVGSTPPVSYQAAAQLERLLDGRAGSAFKAGDIPLAQAYKTLRNGVGDFLESNVPEHANVKAQYATMKANEEALQAGAAAWKNPSARDVAAEFKAMTPAQQTLYRKGLASSAIDQLGNRNSNLNAATPFTNASASTQQKLQTIFGDQPTFDRFMEGAKAERQMSHLNEVTGGSATARRGADESAETMGMAMRGATSLAHGRGAMSTMLHTFAPAVVNGMRNQTALDAGSLLTTQGDDAITQLLTKLQTPDKTMGLLTQGGVGLAGGAGGLLSGLLSPHQ